MRSMRGFGAIRSILAALMLVLVAGLLPAGCGTAASTTSSGPTVPPSLATTTEPETTTTSSGSAPTAAQSSSTTQKPTSTTRSPLAGEEFEVFPTEDKVVCLTFDAAYEPAPLAGILAALDEAGAVGTFFLTGEFVEDFPQEVTAIKRAGYDAGSHSYSHPDFLELDEAQIEDQLQRTASLMTEAGLADPRPLFRFPYGSRDSRTLATVGEEGYVSIYWTIDTLDWETERTTDQIRQVILDRLRPGAIVLMHVGSPQTAQILPQILEDLKDRGYETIGVREALAKYGN